MADKPTIHLTVAKVRKEVEKPEPFGIGLSNSKVVIFPDVYAMESVAAEEMFEKLNRSATNWNVLGQWLSEQDCEALKAEKLSIVELSTVVRAAMEYYEDHYGTAGEGSASAG